MCQCTCVWELAREDFLTEQEKSTTQHQLFDYNHTFVITCIHVMLSCPNLHLSHTLTVRDGQLRVDDQITHINGRPLKDLPHSEGVKLLQSSRGMVELVVMRDVSPAYPAPPLTSTSSLHHKLSPDPPNVVHSLSAHPSFSDKVCHLHSCICTVHVWGKGREQK